MPLVVDNKYIAFDDLMSLQDLSVAHPELSQVYDILTDWFDEDKTTLSASTSGSTGTPKEIQISKTAMKSSAEKTAHYFKFKSGDWVLNSLPLNFIAGKMMIVRSIVSELNLVVVPPTSTPLVGYEKYNFDFVPLTPFQLLQSLSQVPASLQRVKNILLGGGPVMPQLMSQLTQLTSTVYHGYGMTETITHVAVRNLSAGERNFKPLPGVDISINPERQLIIEADHLKDRIVTNDLGSLDASGAFTWLGRVDNVINSGGVKIIPEEIEELLKSHLDCDVLISSVKDELLGEKVILILETEKMPNDIDKLLHRLLTKYQLPKAIYLLPSFIRTETQKIQRKATVTSAIENI